MYDVDLTDAAASLKTPTLLLHARGDQLVPWAAGRHLAGVIPGAQFVSLPARVSRRGRTRAS